MNARRGFTLVEIMIVVAIIGLLATIAVPSFLRARASARRSACINNLRQIVSGKDQYALEYGGEGNLVLNHSDAGIYIKDTNKVYCNLFPRTSRSFHNYDIRAISNDPVCRSAVGSNQNHTLRHVGM